MNLFNIYEFTMKEILFFEISSNFFDLIDSSFVSKNKK